MKTHPGKVTCHALLRVSLFSMDFVAAYMNFRCESCYKRYSSMKVSPERGVESKNVRSVKSVRNSESDSELQKSNAYCNIFL